VICRAVQRLKVHSKMRINKRLVINEAPSIIPRAWGWLSVNRKAGTKHAAHGEDWRIHDLSIGEMTG
jgi:hypothetical protein